jgi:FkbH-like protein
MTFVGNSPPPMILRKSRFIHQLPVGPDRVLLVHAVSHLRLAVGPEVSRAVDYFERPRVLPDDYAGLAELLACDRAILEGCVNTLVERGVLTERSPDEELADITAKLSATHGRDPVELLERYRRELKEGSAPYWAAGTALGLSDFKGVQKRLDVILLGECDIHMEADFLRREAARRGLDLRVAATFPDDFAFATEHKHDAILIGALRARHTIAGDLEPVQTAHHAHYVAHARLILERLRERTSAPILIDNLPEPTVQPLGLAERGLAGHRNRFRLTNVALADLVESFADVHVVDVAAALAAIGSARMVDDGQVGFTHLGSPGWLLQRPESEKAAVHGIFPDMAELARSVDADPYGREAAVARTHVDALAVILGLDRKKCVIVDLDGTLWPGVLAETGSPFAWDPAISGVFSYVGLYFGLHEALLCLKRRGIVLACVSKNDEATVKELWKYPDHYPRQRLLALDDFVTWRINWNDKVDNIRSIAEQLGFALETFLFIDDHPIERDRVRTRLPEVEVWGENPFGLRRALLDDPRLQLPRITAETAARTDLVKAQLGRQQFRAETLDEADYIASLNIQCRIERLGAGAKLERIAELFQRTTQFNTTGHRFSAAELGAMLSDPATHVFSIEVADRFGDHGLVGAAVVERGEIKGLVMSCRVLGLGVEHTFLQHIVQTLKANLDALTARIVATPRNIPVRNIYRDNGFVAEEDGSWRLKCA